MAIGVMQLYIFLMDILYPGDPFNKGRLFAQNMRRATALYEELRIHRQIAGGTCPQFLLPLSMYNLDHI